MKKNTLLIEEAPEDDKAQAKTIGCVLTPVETSALHVNSNFVYEDDTHDLTFPSTDFCFEVHSELQESRGEWCSMGPRPIANNSVPLPMRL